MSLPMSQDTWTAVDEYITRVLHRPDPVLDAAIEASTAAGLPSIAVSPAIGKLLSLLAGAQRARTILEVGTLGGYSTIWLARALPPGGRVVTLELSPKHAEIAAANIARAGLSDLVEVRVGPAAEMLRRLIDEKHPPFDFIFIDADKPGYPEYLTLSLRLAAPGTLIVADNVVRDGAVADAASTDPNVLAVRRYHEMVAAEPRLSGTVMQTVGSKGYDGLAIALVKE